MSSLNILVTIIPSYLERLYPYDALKNVRLSAHSVYMHFQNPLQLPAQPIP